MIIRRTDCIFDPRYPFVVAVVVGAAAGGVVELIVRVIENGIQ